MSGSHTSVSLDGLLAELDMYQGNLKPPVEVVVVDTDMTQFDIVDVFAEGGRLYLQVRERELGVKPA